MKRFDDELWLLTPEEFTQLPYGVKLKCINGVFYIKDIDFIDQDTRFGCIAYGLTKELVEEQNLQHEFLVMILKS